MVGRPCHESTRYIASSKCFKPEAQRPIAESCTFPILKAKTLKTMTERQPTDAAIIAQIRSESAKETRDAVAHMLQIFRGLVYAIVVRPGIGTQEDADDILNDSVSDLVLRLREEDFHLRETRLSTFFYAIAKNKWLNILRGRARTLHTSDISLQVEVPSDAPAPLDDLIAREQRTLIHQALSKLDDSCFSLLYQFWIEDKKLKDIAINLRISEMSVKKRHERCRKKLRKFLEKQQHNP